jgi:aminopeptidase N
LPSFDDVNEKLVFNISIEAADSLTALSNGILKRKKKIANKNTTLWQYEMQQPMSSYLVMVALGQFEKQVAKTKSKTPLEFYLPLEKAHHLEPTFRYTVPIFDFLESEIGVKYPWNIYRQAAVKDFLYAGMENTTATLFSTDFVVDSIGFHDKTYCNVNAHELAHQWFGNLVTATSGQHHWLQEGFATYYALLAERHIFGEDYFHWELYNMAERLKIASKEDTIPILNPKASSLTFYQKGAWALHYLKTKVGATVFREAVKVYVEKNAYQTVSTDDFLAEIAKRSTFDVAKYRRKWLESAQLPLDEMLEILKENQFIKDYFSLLNLQTVPFAEKAQKLHQYMEQESFYPLQEEVLYQVSSEDWQQKKDFILKGFQHPSLQVRQTIAQTLTEIPDEIKPQYESLLEDKSYITQEIALGTLWTKFPKDQPKYLEMSKNWIGFNDKNLRILWLTLALMTPNYEMNRKPIFYDELLAYASNQYESTIRQNALTNLLYLNPRDENVMRHLIQATTHHKWQFTLFARNQIKALAKNEAHLNFFKKMEATLSETEKTQLQKILTGS